MFLLSKSTQPLLDNRYQQMAVSGCVLWLIGGWLSGLLVFNTFFWILWSIIALILFLLFLVSHQSHLLLKLSLGFLIIVSSALFGQLNTQLFHRLPNIQRYLEQQHYFQYTIESANKLDANLGLTTQWRIRINQVDNHLLEKPFDALLQLNLTQATHPLHIGDSVKTSLTLQQPFDAGFPGGFNYRYFLQQDNILALAKIPSNEVLTIVGQNPAPQYFIQRSATTLREQLVKRFNNALPQQEAQLLGSIVLGEHASPIDGTLKTNFRNAGLAHILAASGMNVGLIATFVLWITTLFKVPFRLKIIICMLVSAFYTVMTGLPPSILRAGLMLEMALLLTLLERKLSALLVLNIAAIVLSCFNPNILQTISFQLSYLSTFGLIAMTPPLEKWLGFYTSRVVATLILVPVIAQLWVIPIQLYVFHQLSLTALPANIVAVPVVAICTYGGFGMGLLSLILPAIGQFFISWLWLPLVCLKWISEILGQGLLTNIPIGQNSVWLCMLMYSVLFILGIFGENLVYLYCNSYSPKQLITTFFKATLIILCVVMTPYSLAKFQNSHTMQCKIFSNKQWGNGNALFQLKSGERILIINSYASSNLLNLKNYLNTQGIRDVNVLLIPSETPTRNLTQIKFIEMLRYLNIDKLYYTTTDAAWPDLLSPLETIHKTKPYNFSEKAVLKTGRSELLTLENNNQSLNVVLEDNKKPVITWQSGEHESLKNASAIQVTSFNNEPMQYYLRQVGKPLEQFIGNSYLDIRSNDNKHFAVTRF